MNIYQELLTEVNQGRSAVMLTTVNTETHEAVKKTCYTDNQLESAFAGSLQTDPVLLALKASLTDGNVEIYNREGTMTVIEPFYPEPSLIILGGGHIAKPLCEYAARVGFRITVVDDRPAFANQNRFPDASEVICGAFEHSINHIPFTPSTFVVIVTRGHRHDLDCLRAVLPKPWAYAGMIGSKRRVAGILEQLHDDGYPSEMLAKVKTPIGLPIGAVTPEEIAVSILAELISYRRLVNPALGKDSNVLTRTEFDRQILEELAWGYGDSKAIVTIISTKGSVPRKAGAKMLVWPDGRIMGSIGGGCCESEVIREARSMLDFGGFRLYALDLTAEMAEEAGMVCGGIMQVLIEAVTG